MNLLSRIALSVTLALLAGCAASSVHSPSAPAVATSAPPLLLISIDGYRADYLQRHLSPTLEQLADEGVHAQSMQPAFPSLTFPNHYTLITGLRPDHHGIVNNTMNDPVLGHFSLGDRAAVSDGRWWDQAIPLWESADARGLRTATMFWPGAEADIHGHHPDYWLPFDGKITATQRVDQLLQWLDLPPAQRPRLLTLYFDAVDHAGHGFGPDSPQVDEAIGQTDQALARLVDGLKQRGLFNAINIIIVSDHGMASTPAGNTVLIDKLIGLDSVQTVTLGVLAGFNPKPGHDFSAIERQLSAPQAHMQCWDKTAIPARFGYGANPRVPQLDCLADVGWQISTSAYLASHHGHTSLGDHGYDNADPHMRALFVAHGPSFRQGLTVAEFPNVDVYPLMTHLLGIKAEPNDGSYQQVREMLVPQAQ